MNFKENDGSGTTQIENNGFSRLIDLPRYQLARFPREDALVAISGDTFTRYSTQKFVELVDRVSAGLWAAGYRKGDKLCIISANRPEWNFVDLGMQQIGVVNVPAFRQLSPEEYTYILNDAGIKAVFVSDQKHCDDMQRIVDEVPSLEKIYTFEKLEGGRHWNALLEDVGEKDRQGAQEARGALEADDLATIVYTSGTTGKPKGVMLSHKNIISNLRACLSLLPVHEQHRALSFLPLNHVFERMMSYLYMSAGIAVYYAENVDTVGDNMRLVKPHIFTTVPRLLEKVYEKIVKKGQEQTGLRRRLFDWSLGLAKRYEIRGKGPWYRLQRAIADRLIFAKWRSALGGELICLVSGGAALNPMLARTFTAAGVPVLEGYGLTETAPVIAVNRMELENLKFGTVGKVLDNVAVKIDEDGEILARGPNVMLGYYRKPEKTEAVMDKDGWLRTGDIGQLDQEGFLSISDRKSSLFKTSGGKYVAPQPIENQFNESPYIENLVVVGEGRKMVTALIQPDFENLKEWCEKNDIQWAAKKEILRNDKVNSLFESIVEKYNEPLGHTEMIKKFRLIPDEWSPGSGELTPTLKPKREVIHQRYKEKIEEMYAVE
jgi:long-chain acyl-CoA synthetase